MGYTAKELIDLRRRKWAQDPSLDKELVASIVLEIIECPELKREVTLNPELLIEMCFSIVDKDKKTVPFILNRVQRKFVDRLNSAITDFMLGLAHSIKFLVLKSRQQGFTALITAYQLACTITRKNFEGFTAADEEGNTSAIFENKAKHVLSMLPARLKPSEKYNNRRQLLFDKLHSSWEAKTASKNMGRSRTINFFHGSEAAFWRDGISGIQAGLGEALTKDAIQILESTANGYNEYKDLWDDGQWTNCFFEWWETEEYRLVFEDDKAKAEFLKTINTGTKWIHERCRWLLNAKELDAEQVYWYYKKYQGYIVKETIRQEYPCSADEAFLASGSCIFNKEKIIQRKAYLEKLYADNPPKVGEFLITWNDPDRLDYPIAYSWVDNPNGAIKIYNAAQAGHPYTVGGDTKGEGSDWFAATVKDNNTGERVATLHMQGLTSKPYSAQVWALGSCYNEALIGIEVNFNTYPVELLTDWHYPRQYMREKTDTFTKEVKKAYGWRTDGNTRPLIIERAITNVEENIENYNDIATLGEMLTFIKDEDGRYDAESGKHDDLLFSDMIADAIGSQQSHVVEEAPEPDEDDEDEIYDTPRINTFF